MTLNTKLTATEFAEVETYCEARGTAFGEWVRDIVLREVRTSGAETPNSALLGEIAGLRLLLVNGLETLLRGDKMTAEQFKAMLQYVKGNKRKAATDALASYAEGGNE